MSHKVNKDGVIYNVVSGKANVGGTTYNISKGNTLVGGTQFSITFDGTPASVASHLCGGTATAYTAYAGNPPVASTNIDNAYTYYKEFIDLTHYYIYTVVNGTKKYLIPHVDGAIQEFILSLTPQDAAYIYYDNTYQGYPIIEFQWKPTEALGQVAFLIEIEREKFSPHPKASSNELWSEMREI